MTSFITKFNDHFIDKFADTFTTEFNYNSPRPQYRRKRVLSKYLEGFNQSKIAELENVSRSTICRDLKNIKQTIKPTEYTQIIEDSVTNLRKLRQQILQTAEKSPPQHAHRYHKLAIEIDEFLIQQIGTDKNTNKEILELQKTTEKIIDFISDRYGPESMTALIDYLQNYFTIKDTIK